MDNHATTRVDPRVVEAMLPYYTDEYGNAGSVSHAFGQRARQAVEDAQAAIAGAIGAGPNEIVFTSGATESNNLAIRGVVTRRRRRGDHLVSVATEHKAVLEPLERLAADGYDVTLLNVKPHGNVRAGWLEPEKVANVLRDDTCLVSVMLANNEIGVLQPLAEISALCKSHGVLVHTDATQAVGKVPTDVRNLGVDLMSFSAHKIYGPKGIGALYVRGRGPVVRLDPQITGGGQQGGRRSGTLNVPGIVGFAKALELCQQEMSRESKRLSELRDELAANICARLPNVEVCGPALDRTANEDSLLRLPGNLNLAFGDVDGEALMLAMGDVAVSSGATCTSADPEPSHVLRALGMTDDLVRSSLRFGLGRFNTSAEVARAADLVVGAVERLRSLGAG